MYKEVVFEEPKPVEEKEEEKPKKELFPVNDNDKELVKLEEGKPKFEYTLKKVAINAVILGCFANALSIFNFDPILQLDIYAFRLLGFRVYISEIIIVFIGICALYIHSIIDELVYPSFNHFTFLPEKLLTNKKSEKSDIIVEVAAPPNSKVIYWGAKNKPDANVREAYDDFSNGGVVKTDANGVAKLEMVKGSGYLKESGPRPRHVHYRYVDEKKAKMSKILTKYY